MGFKIIKARWFGVSIRQMDRKIERERERDRERGYIMY